MDAHLLIRELGSSLGVDLTLDSNLSCAFASDDDCLCIQYQPQDETFLVFAPVQINEQGFSKSVYEAVLQANLFGQATLGMHLGYYMPASSIVLSGSVAAATLTPAELEDYLSFFAAELKKWQHTLQQLDGEEAPAEHPGQANNEAASGASLTDSQLLMQMQGFKV